MVKESILSKEISSPLPLQSWDAAGRVLECLMQGTSSALTMNVKFSQSLNELAVFNFRSLESPREARELWRKQVSIIQQEVKQVLEASRAIQDELLRACFEATNVGFASFEEQPSGPQSEEVPLITP